MEKTYASRAEIAARDLWKLEDIYATNADWEAECLAARAELARIGAYAGQLKTREDLLAALRLQSALNLKIERLYCYARMRRDENNADPAYQALVDRAQALAVESETDTAFLSPELLALDPQYLEDCINDPEFADYDFSLREVLRRRPHTLDAAGEKLVAMTGEMGAAPDTIYTMLTEADMRFPKIVDAEGKRVELTQANYIPFMTSRDRRVRKAAFTALYGTFAKYASTVPAVYAASVKADEFYAGAANFASAREARLFDDAVPGAVYDRLIEVARAHLPGLNRLVKLNARRNGLTRPAMFDVYAEPAQDFDIRLPFDEAYALVVDCLSALGADYQAVLRRAREERWIDAFSTPGKSSGAYSWGTYDTHPYVLLNYHENLDGVQTIAHEMGHAMHSFLSNARQPYAKAEYSLFVAEVASTVNEVLLLLELMERNKENDQAQLYLLYNLLDSYRTTLFRQTMFAEFERESHRMAEAGEPLTGESLNACYANLNKAYYACCQQTKGIELEWMRIPHFYRAFYVYQYATGFSSAMALAAMIRSEGAPAVARYKEFLSTGGSVHPLEALKIAGVDMADGAPVERALAMFEELLDRYERLAKG